MTTSGKHTAYDFDAATRTTRGWQKKTAGYWLKEARASFARECGVKRADDGDSGSTPFEQSFSNLAHASVLERAGKLLEYEVGFSLIERSSDATRAVGAFGFKVGDQWLYIPVFFLNGQLKGTELLYIKNQSMFVPTKESWINYLLGRKPNLLGKTVERNLSNLGVLSPNLYQLSRSPYKIASYTPKLPAWAQDFVAIMGKLALTKVSMDSGLYLQAVRDSGLNGIAHLTKTGSAYPKVYQHIRHFYGDGTLTKTAAEIGDDLRRASGNPLLKGLEPKKSSQFFKKAAPSEPDDVQVIVRRDISGGNAPAYILSDKERTQLAEEGRVVKDNRTESAISKVYNMTTSLKVFSPSETNIYEVLIKPDSFEKCLVIKAPYCQTGRRSFCTVVSLESDNRWLNIHPSRVLCRTEYSRDAWNEWYDKQKDAKDLPVADDQYSSGGPKFVLFSRGGQGTCPLKVTEKYSSGDNSGDVYDVHFSDYCEKADGKLGVVKREGEDRWGWFGRNEEHSEIKTVRLLDRIGNKFRAGPHELYVPGDAKMVTVAAKKPKSDEPSYVEDSGSKPKALQPGDMADVMFAIQAALPPLRLLSDRSEKFDINTPKDINTPDDAGHADLHPHGAGPGLDKESAFKLLVINWGLRADMADMLLKEAASQPLTSIEYRVKLAPGLRKKAEPAGGDPYLTNGGPTAPGWLDQPYTSDYMMGSQSQMQMPYAREQIVRSMMPNQADRALYLPKGPDPDTMSTAMSAAQTGQKEIFDISMLGSLLKTVGDQSIIDRNLPNIRRGMSDIGTILFQFYWHGKTFEDRYGASELPEIEDGLRNVFESTGELYLKLKQKGVDQFNDDAGTMIDLEGVARQ